jgi:major histocompatibility complex class I
MRPVSKKKKKKKTRESVRKINLLKKLEKKLSWAVVAHAFNPSTWEAEAGGFLSLRPAWSTE